MRIYIYMLFLFCSLSTSAFGYPIITDKIEGTLSLLPFASWFAESENAVGITKASTPEMQKNYEPVGKGFGFKEKGAGWLRLELKKTSPSPGLLPQNNTGDLFLKVGTLPSGTSSIYYQDNLDPTKTPGIWFATALHAFESRQLPEPPLSGNTVYIHFEETPGPWFSPILEKNTKNSFVFPSDTVLIGFLLCGIIVCLLRSIKDKALWPLWASFLLGLGLIQVVLPLPLLSKQLELKDLPPLIAPGFCLIIFPHLARLMLRTKESSLAQDAFLKVLPFLGVIVSLVPLLPEYNWLTRLFPLWALFLFPLLPISLQALRLKKPGSLIFTGACLLPVLGAIWSLSSLFIIDIHPLAEEGGLWGLAIGGIFLFLAGVPKSQKRETSVSAKEQNKKVDSSPLEDEVFPQLDGTPLVEPSTSLFSFVDDDLENQDLKTEQIKETDIPSLFPDEEKKEPEGLADVSMPTEKDKEQPVQLEETTKATDDFANLDEEPSFNIPASTFSVQADTSSTKATLGGLSSLFQENNTSPLPFEEKKDTQSEEITTEVVSSKDEKSSDILKDSAQIEQDQNEVSFANKLANSIEKIHKESLGEIEKENTKVISLASEDFSDPEWEKQASLMRASVPVGESYIFSLHSLIRDVHNTAIPLAEDKDILLSWFISPSLPSFLKGDVVSLRQALSLLVQNAVQATNKGAVQLFVKHAPTTTASDLGRLQFTISDTGVAQRADSGFFHAWELAQRTGGCFSIEYSVSGGTLIIFSVKFEIPSDELLQQHLSSLTEENTERVLTNPHDSYSKAFPLTQQLLKTLDIHSPETTLEAPFDTAIEADLDPSMPLFIITDMTISNKRLLSHYLSSIPHATIDPKSIVGVIEIVQKTTPSLVIYDADSPEDMIISSMHAVIEWRKQQKLSPLPQLVIAGHEGQAKRMQKAGATKVLLKPFSQEEILEVLNAFFPSEQNMAIELPEKNVTTPAHNQSQKNTFLQEEKDKETEIEQEEGTTDDHSSIKNTRSTETTESKIILSDPFEITLSEEETPVAPLIQNLRQEDLQPNIPASSSPSHAQTEIKKTIENVNTNEDQTKSKVEEGTRVSPQKEESKRTTEVSESTLDTEEKNIVITEAKEDTPKAAGTLTQSEETDDAKQTSVTFDASAEEKQEKIEEKDKSAQPVSRLEEAGELLFGTVPTGNYLLPGMDGETIEVVMLPLLPGLLNTLGDTLTDAMKARKEHQTIFIQEAVSRLANKAEAFGLERLGKIGRCVERAAEADDFEAVDTLLDDLIIVTGRYIESLKECYESFLSEARE